MGRLAGKVIEASVVEEPRDARGVGPELRRLRLLSGLTQAEMASRLDIQQAAISKIEKGREVYLTTVQRYVEALGASLRVDAVFPADAQLALHIRDAFDAECGHDDQLVLPLLGDEPFRAQRDVVLSIRPQYSEKILEGRKTVELRRRFPVSAPGGTVAYIYSTSPVRAMVGVAEIKDVLKLPIEQIWAEFEDTAFIQRKDFTNYFQGLDFGFALLFEDVKSFSRPIPLNELRTRFGFEPPQSFLYASRDLRKALRHEPAIVSH
ncbi:helix-turn-helix domain-containing protein [Aminobacter aminovorans]|uniref:helix-turn-helix domain-containing protein n=1 Tax=Aminobacter aminovorans TaxID=83263 RepID=UPI0028642F13|nr:helix-turn-helix domain-containing protein [Aminobacter aminovorans]MDR7223682.1 putative transcriptional regulator/DNA-binding XRE family transcriptional regulator [Aminobacter aminovorans]